MCLRVMLTLTYLSVDYNIISFAGETRTAVFGCDYHEHGFARDAVFRLERWCQRYRVSGV